MRRNQTSSEEPWRLGPGEFKDASRLLRLRSPEDRVVAIGFGARSCAGNGARPTTRRTLLHDRQRRRGAHRTLLHAGRCESACTRRPILPGDGWRSTRRAIL